MGGLAMEILHPSPAMAMRIRKKKAHHPLPLDSPHSTPPPPPPPYASDEEAVAGLTEQSKKRMRRTPLSKLPSDAHSQQNDDNTGEKSHSNSASKESGGGLFASGCGNSSPGPEKSPSSALQKKQSKKKKKKKEEEEEEEGSKKMDDAVAKEGKKRSTGGIFSGNGNFSVLAEEMGIMGNGGSLETSMEIPDFGLQSSNGSSKQKKLNKERGKMGMDDPMCNNFLKEVVKSANSEKRERKNCSVSIEEGDRKLATGVKSKQDEEEEKEKGRKIHLVSIEGGNEKIASGANSKLEEEDKKKKKKRERKNHFVSVEGDNLKLVSDINSKPEDNEKKKEKEKANHEFPTKGGSPKQSSVVSSKLEEDNEKKEREKNHEMPIKVGNPKQSSGANSKQKEENTEQKKKKKRERKNHKVAIKEGNLKQASSIGANSKQEDEEDEKKKKEKKRRRRVLEVSENKDIKVLQDRVKNSELNTNSITGVDPEIGANVEPSGMDIYWKLASADAQARESAAVALVQRLEAAQEAWEGKVANGKEEIVDAVLLGASKDDEELKECAPEVRYALRRLVRGVSSSRESARQGFALALAAVLGALDCIKGFAVLNLVKKALEVTSSMKGQEARDGLLGQLFAYGAIVQADRLICSDTSSDEQISLVKDVTEQLLLLSRKKSVLREPSVAVLLRMIEKIPMRSLQDGVMASLCFREMVSVNPANVDPDTLLLLLNLSDQLPASMKNTCAVLPESGDLFTPLFMSSIIPCLQESSRSLPRVHPVWTKLLDLMCMNTCETPVKIRELEKSTKKRKKKVLENRDEIGTGGKLMTLDQRLELLWNVVVDKALLLSSHERKYLAMELLLLLLPRLPASSIEIVLSQNFVLCLLDALSAKQNYLYKSAERCLQELCNWAKGDEQRITSVVISLQQVSHGKFDGVSKTRIVKNLLSNFSSKDGSFFFLNCLIDYFTRGPFCYRKPSLLQQIDIFSKKDQSKDVGVDINTELSVETTLDTHRLWVLDQMLGFVKHVQLEQQAKLELYKRLVKFLGLHSLFSPPDTKTAADLEQREEIKWPQVPLSESTRKLCLLRLQGLLADAQQPAMSNKLSSNDLQSGISGGGHSMRDDLVSSFLSFCSETERNAVFLECHSKEDKEAFITLKSAIFKLSAAIQKGSLEQKVKVQAMCGLLLQLFLQMMLSKSDETVLELVICCKKAFGDLIDPQTESEEEAEEEDEAPALIDVLVDVLLSLLAQASASIRAAAEQVFKSFCDDIGEVALLSMVRVIKKQLQSGRHKPSTTMDDENDGEEEEDQLLGVEDSDEEMEPNDDDDDDDGDDDDTSSSDRKNEEDAEDEGVSKKAKGFSSLDEHEGNSDESDADFDDEAMFRVDAHLAKILKQKKMGGGGGGNSETRKDAQTQLMHFKYRVLSLVEYFLQKKADSPLVLFALPHLLQALVFACSTEGSEGLVDRIGSILQNKLFKVKRYPKESSLDPERIRGLLERSLKLASRTKFKKVGSVAQACFLWLLKVFQSSASFDISFATEIFEKALEDFFDSKKSRLNSAFFNNAFSRYKWLGRGCVSVVLKRCASARTEYLQYEAIRVASEVLRLSSLKELASEGDPKAVRNFLSPLLSLFSEVFISLLEKPITKASRKVESRRFCMLILRLLSEYYQDKSLKKLIGSSAYDICLKSLGLSVVESACKLMLAV